MSTCSRRRRRPQQQTQQQRLQTSVEVNKSPFCGTKNLTRHHRHQQHLRQQSNSSTSTTATNATLQPASLSTTRPPTPPAPAIRNVMTQAHILRQRDASRTQTPPVRLIGGAASVRTVDHGIARDLPTSEYCIELSTYELVWPTFRFAPKSAAVQLISTVDPRNHASEPYLGPTTSVSATSSHHRQHHHHLHSHHITTVNNFEIHYSMPFNDTYGTNIVYLTSPRLDSVDAYAIVAISKAVTRQLALDVDVIIRYWTKVQRSPTIMTNTMTTNDGQITDRVLVTRTTCGVSCGQDVEVVPRAWKTQRQKFNCSRTNSSQLYNIINDRKLFKGRWAAIFKLPDDCVESIRNLPGRPLSAMVQVQRRVLEYSGHKKIAGCSNGRMIKPNGPFADLRIRVLYPFGIKKPMTPIEARIDTTVMAMRSESFRRKIEAKLVSMGQLERLTLSKLEFSVQHPHALTIRPSFMALPSANTTVHRQLVQPQSQQMLAVKASSSGDYNLQIRSAGNSKDSFDSSQNNNIYSEDAAARLYNGGGPHKRPRLDSNHNSRSSGTNMRTVHEMPSAGSPHSSADDVTNADVVVVNSNDSIKAHRNSKIVRVNMAPTLQNDHRGSCSLLVTNSNGKQQQIVQQQQQDCEQQREDDCTQQITFNYMSPEALREFTRYIYEGLINPVCYDFLTTAQLYAASDKMHFDELKKPLLDRMCFLMEAGVSSDLFDAFSLAYELKVPVIQRHAEILVEKYAKTVLHGEDWDEFKNDYPDLIAELVRALA